jgi:hypothetical protein
LLVLFFQVEVIINEVDNFRWYVYFSVFLVPLEQVRLLIESPSLLVGRGLPLSVLLVLQRSQSLVLLCLEFLYTHTVRHMALGR